MQKKFTARERQQMQEYLDANPTPPKVKDRTAVPQDYQVMRRKLHKGVFAPEGFVFLVVIVNVPKIYGVNVNLKKGSKATPTKYISHKIIPSKAGIEFDKGVADGLRQLIEEKFNY